MSSSNFYIGQKVRYLNQKGDGVITKITSQQIMVEDSSGFEIPFQAKELVPAESEEIIKDTVVSSAGYVSSVVNTANAKKFFSEGVYLFVVNLKEQGFEILLVNETDYSISINLFLQEQSNLQFFQNSFLKPKQHSLLCKLKNEEIGQWQHVAAQILFSKEVLTKLPETYHVTKKIDGKKFFDDHHFVLSKYHQLPVFDICLYAPQMKEEDIVLSEAIVQQFFKRDVVETKKSVPHFVEEELIIDLHIEELIENFTTYTPSTLLQIQVNKIKSEIERGYSKNRKEIIFIHGVGKGVLKTEMVKILKTFPHVRFHDAPYSRFGYGATVVELH